MSAVQVEFYEAIISDDHVKNPHAHVEELISMQLTCLSFKILSW
jgi:hypothetical protein